MLFMFFALNGYFWLRLSEYTRYARTTQYIAAASELKPAAADDAGCVSPVIMFLII